MSAVELKIVEPAHDTAVIGDTPVTFKGEITRLPEELVNVTLYYRWYSSLFPAEKDRYSINENALTNPAIPFTTMLGVGSHVISLAASDRPGETEADQNATQHGGVVGGSAGDGKCLIHVFKANLMAPGGGATLSKASSTLEAEAPLKWGQRLSETDPFEPNDEYHKHNRLQYRWEFKPVGAPPGRKTINFVPTLDQLMFDIVPNPDPLTSGQVPELAVIRYVGPLPTAFGSDTGSYTLTLHVEDKDKDANIGSHQVTINVQVVD